MERFTCWSSVEQPFVQQEIKKEPVLWGEWQQTPPRPDALENKKIQPRFSVLYHPKSTSSQH